jgi:DNA-binding transcriptional LysR family regulator
MDLNRAATFLRVVETGGFTAAANQLGLPTSSVSRSVAKLEDELGVVLLERTTRRVSLTEVGRAYFERVRDALAGLDEATAAALDAAREPHGTIRIAVPPDFAPVLATSLAGFLRSYPRIRIEVATTARPADQVGEHADLGVAFGKLPDSSLVSRRLGETAHQLFAAAAYLAARGRPRTLGDLARHDAIVLGSAHDRWDLIGPRGPESVQVAGRIAADHLGFAIEATRAAMGIALLPAFLVAAHVASGELVEVLPRYTATVQMQILTHAARRMPHRVALLRDYLVEHMSTACRSHGKPSAASRSA